MQSVSPRDIIIGMSTTRREFLQAAAALTLASTTIDAATGMPMRPLGRTGKKVSILAFGCDPVS